MFKCTFATGRSFAELEGFPWSGLLSDEPGERHSYMWSEAMQSSFELQFQQPNKVILIE